MVLGFVMLYLLVNVFLGFSMHDSLRHSWLMELEPGELLFCSLLFLVAGLPILLVSLLFRALRNAMESYHHPSAHRLHHN